LLDHSKSIISHRLIDDSSRNEFSPIDNKMNHNQKIKNINLKSNILNSNENIHNESLDISSFDEHNYSKINFIKFNNKNSSNANNYNLEQNSDLNNLKISPFVKDKISFELSPELDQILKNENFGNVNKKYKNDILSKKVITNFNDKNNENEDNNSNDNLFDINKIFKCPNSKPKFVINNVNNNMINLDWNNDDNNNLNIPEIKKSSNKTKINDNFTNITKIINENKNSFSNNIVKSNLFGNVNMPKNLKNLKNYLNKKSKICSLYFFYCF